MCSATVVATEMLNLAELLGYVMSLVLLCVFTLGLGVGISWSTHIALNRLAALSALAFPVVTLGWYLLAFRLPGTSQAPELLPRNAPTPGPVSAIGPAGVAIVMFSMASVMAALWVLGDRRIRWRVRIPVVLAVFAAHVPLVVWLMGRPSA